MSVYDPMVDDWEGVDISLEKKLPNANDYDVVVFAVKHKEFKKIDLSLWANNSKVLIFDGNNVLSRDQRSDIKNYNLNYLSIGRG